MNLIKNDPFKPAIARGFFDDFFNGTVSDFMGSDYGMTIPAVNVRETEEGYFLELAVPGLTFNISVEKNLLLSPVKKRRLLKVRKERYAGRNSTTVHSDAASTCQSRLTKTRSKLSMTMGF